MIWLNRVKDPQGRLARWALGLQPLDFKLIYRKGKDHVVPDMSRSVPLAEHSIQVNSITPEADFEDQDFAKSVVP